MIRLPAARWGAAALLVTVGWLATPDPVAVYDGVGQPDEPYRYVSPPPGAPPARGAATSATATTPVAAGAGTDGLSVTTAEVGPQLAVFLPAGSFAAPGGTITVTVTPKAPADQPPGGRIDGNVYALGATDPAGPVTLTAKATLATIYLRATSGAQPGPVLERRESAGGPWTALKTSRGGADVYVAALPGLGDYALVFGPVTAVTGSGTPVLPYLLGGVLAVLVAVVLVVRRRARVA